MEARWMRVLAKLLTAALFLLVQSGCSGTSPRKPDLVSADEFIAKIYAAVDHLVAQFDTRRDKEVTKGPIIVATIVNIDELTESSRLGRTVSETIASRLSQRGYQVIELKLRGNIFVQRSQGELLLSRELRDISISHKAQAVVVGTYSTAKNFVHLNLKVISGDTQNIVAATDFGLPLDANTLAMLPK